MAPVFPPSSIGSERISRSLTERAGRNGALRLAFARRGAQTVLTERRFTLPHQALEPIALDDSGCAYLTLLNPTGGLVGGDSLDAEIVLHPRAHVCLTTPSASKVYRTLGLPALQRTTIHVGSDAVVEYLPDHLIPFPGSALHQSLRIDLAEGSRALIYDAFAIGRAARGERWLFKELGNEIVVICAGLPIFLDRVKLSPSTSKLDGIGGMENFGYVATFGLFAESFTGWEKLAGCLRDEMKTLSRYAGGVSLLARCGCITRLRARSAVDLEIAKRRIWLVARRELLGLPASDLRKF